MYKGWIKGSLLMQLRAGGVTHLVERLPSKCKALSSNPSTAKKKKKKKKKTAAVKNNHSQGERHW
jgi:hypothetical protein